MSRHAISLTISDTSAFARSLRSELLSHKDMPGHLGMLGAIARAAGYGNYQHLRATQDDTPAPPQPDAAATKPPRALERALRVFDAAGVMTRWPKQYSAQALCLWVFWSDLPAKADLTEPEVNAILKAGSSFGDHVLLRRALIDTRVATRAIDGSSYRRIEQAPPPDAREIIREIRRRRAAAA